MPRLLSIFLGLVLLIGSVSGALAASRKATELRQANGLIVFTPTEKFLGGNFVADEMNPAFIFGPVKDFVASLKCPTTWLIEAGEKGKAAAKAGTEEQAEYTLYLEEDCPDKEKTDKDKVVYYVFIDQSGLTPQQWIEWREKFAYSKAEPQYGSTKSKLDQACTEGCGVGAELRFIQVNGELMTKSPEVFLRQDLKFGPIYDLNQRKKLAK